MQIKNHFFVLAIFVLIILSGCTANEKYKSSDIKGALEQKGLNFVYGNDSVRSKSGIYENYNDGTNIFSVNVYSFDSTADAEKLLSIFEKLNEKYAPKKIILENHFVVILGPTKNEQNPAEMIVGYEYKSGNNVVTITAEGCNECEPIGNNFVEWYFSKYPPD